MKKLTLYIPQLALIVGTRALLGAGVGMLATANMEREQRQNLGKTLVAIGILTTIPLAAELLCQNRNRAGKDCCPANDA